MSLPKMRRRISIILVASTGHIYCVKQRLLCVMQRLKSYVAIQIMVKENNANFMNRLFVF